MTTEIRHAVTAAKPNYHRTVLDNGIVVLGRKSGCGYHCRSHFVRAVVVAEPRTGWVGAFAGCSPDEGTSELSSLECGRVESVGASLSTDAAADYFLSLKVTSDFAEIFELAGKLLRSPTFPKLR